VKTNLLHVSIIVLLTVTTACAKRSPDVVNQDAPPPMTSVKSDATASLESPALDASWIALKPDMQLPGLATVERSVSWDERIAKLPEAERNFLIGKNSQYFDALRFSTPEDQRRLVEQGFPMPEEWAKARALPEAELERLAKQGNIKAQMFYVDRVIDQVAPVLKERGFGDSTQDRALYDKFNEASAMSSILLRRTRSPFVAYQNGLMLSVGTLGHSPAIAAGSFQVAKELGDTRADFLSQTFFNAHAALDPQAVMASYSSIKSVLGR
jgi:hypothetical protein